MRKSLFAILAAAASLHALADADIRWLSTTHDFGAFDEDTKKKTAFFRFVNTGDEPVSVISSTATCGCTQPKYSDAPVAPGDTAVIEVSYDPSGRPGRFNKQVYVRTSASPERVRLTIQGTVIGSPVTINGRYPVSIGPLKLSAGAAMMGRVHPGHSKMHYVDGYNMSGDTLSPVVLSSPGYISMRAVPEVVAPGEMVTLNFEFNKEAADIWGILTDSVTIAPAPGMEAVAYPVVTVVEEDFSTLTPAELADAPVVRIDPEKLIFDPIPVNSTAPVTATIKVGNAGKRPLIIRRAYSEDRGVNVDVKKTVVESGKSSDVQVTFDPSVQPDGIVNARLTIITNDPASPTRPIRIVAERK